MSDEEADKEAAEAEEEEVSEEEVKQPKAKKAKKSPAAKAKKAEPEDWVRELGGTRRISGTLTLACHHSHHCCQVACTRLQKNSKTVKSTCVH
jgi:hypothetical protein